MKVPNRPMAFSEELDMSTKKMIALAALASAAAVALPASRAQAASHLWVIDEVFSNADGTIQFIEMHQTPPSCCELFLQNKWVVSVQTGLQYTFPANLEGNTSDRRLLLATAGFAALPGAPAPDYIMADGLVDVTGDSLEYWSYGSATMTFGPGDLPLDGIRSLSRDGSTGPNSPTNYAGESGHVVVPCNPADLDASGDIAFADLLIMLGSWGPCGACAADLDSSGDVGFSDLLILLGAWGPC